MKKQKYLEKPVRKDVWIQAYEGGPKYEFTIKIFEQDDSPSKTTGIHNLKLEISYLGHKNWSHKVGIDLAEVDFENHDLQTANGLLESNQLRLNNLIDSLIDDAKEIVEEWETDGLNHIQSLLKFKGFS